ncbi:hypothetical protein EO216_13805 [Flammeovirga kamogawensis]|uniref:GAF domain-containing protein n=1 Tax=Flammeovirga kamogawensis TaxID=373891 RepID=A0ABX8GUX6_9BACT|nr:hypothetical protein [Flammeovirga kamogawensis]MBB6459606.1 hypothetical protein [Flammeovirga kamogawensis]QWG07331.1 hypothetical protein KM029_18805 [Flammeovirga kamogawensis]TRX69148.1 hypothetical protein EO216_13805 [Flammeovirga kamogawensis]
MNQLIQSLPDTFDSTINSTHLLNQILSKVTDLTKSKYGFIGIVDLNQKIISYSTLIESKSNRSNSSPLPNNIRTTLPSPANRYLPIAKSIKEIHFLFDEKREKNGLPWFSTILLPIEISNNVKVIIGLCDKKDGYNAFSKKQMSALSLKLRKIIKQCPPKDNVSVSYKNSPSNVLDFCYTTPLL